MDKIQSWTLTLDVFKWIYSIYCIRTCFCWTLTLDVFKSLRYQEHIDSINAEL